MTCVAALGQSRDELGRALRKNDVAIDHDRVATKMHRFLGRYVDQIRNVFANRMLAVFIERRREPDRASIGQRTKAGIEMIKARIDKFHRDDETAEHFPDGAGRVDGGAKFVTAE